MSEYGKETPWGKMLVGKYGDSIITANHYELWDWANRTGSRWPGSDLATLDAIVAIFDANGDLVDLHMTPETEMDGAELTAWSDDVKEYADV